MLCDQRTNQEMGWKHSNSTTHTRRAWLRLAVQWHTSRYMSDDRNTPSTSSRQYGRQPKTKLYNAKHTMKTTNTLVATFVTARQGLR